LLKAYRQTVTEFRAARFVVPTFVHAGILWFFFFILRDAEQKRSA
jgi:hypothetical protein